MFKLSGGRPASDWRNENLINFPGYTDLIVPQHHRVLSPGIVSVSGSDHRKLNEELVNQGGSPWFGDLGGELGIVTSVDAYIKFPMFHEGFGQFTVNQGDGTKCSFLTVPTPMAQIFDVKGEHAREVISMIYTNDGGQLWLMPWSSDVDDLSLLGKAKWVRSELERLTIQAGKNQGDSAGYGGRSGANELWKAVVFPMVSGTVWQRLHWLAGAGLKDDDAPSIVAVHQRFRLRFDTDKIPHVSPPQADDLLGAQVNPLNRPFVLAKVMPTPSMEGESYPFQVDWLAHVTMPDWQWA